MHETIALEQGSDYYDGSAGPDPATASGKREEPRWVVLLAHGFGDHSGRWERYGRTLAEAGGAVLACDHRGHGRSEGPRAVVEDFEVVAADFLKLYELPEFPDGVPVALTGHSMGGLIATTAAVYLDPPIDASSCRAPGSEAGRPPRRCSRRSRAARSTRPTVPGIRCSIPTPRYGWTRSRGIPRSRRCSSATSSPTRARIRSRRCVPSSRSRGS